jgi:uncharacterized cupin superfamily protein
MRRSGLAASTTRIADATHPKESAMPATPSKVAILAAEAPERIARYPEPYASRVDGRRKFPLGDLFGLSNFGVNLARLAPGAASSMRHAHAKQDEFIYILQGKPTLHTDEGHTVLAPGMCAGFKAGTRNAHRLVNNGDEEAVCLEVGDRTAGDEGYYPDDDVRAQLVEGKWLFTRKNGMPL